MIDEPLPTLTSHQWRWFTEQLLDRAQHELDRADEKANTLFRLYGVILAAGVGFAVTGYSRALSSVSAWLLLAAAVCALVAGAMLATAPAPRDHRTAQLTAGPRYYGDVVRFSSRGALLAALHAGATDTDGWLVDQLHTVSTIVAKRYSLIRRATGLTWIAIVLTVGAAVAQRV